MTVPRGMSNPVLEGLNGGVTRFEVLDISKRGIGRWCLRCVRRARWRTAERRKDSRRGGPTRGTDEQNRRGEDAEAAALRVNTLRPFIPQHKHTMATCTKAITSVVATSPVTMTGASNRNPGVSASVYRTAGKRDGDGAGEQERVAVVGRDSILP